MTDDGRQLRSSRAYRPRSTHEGFFPNYPSSVISSGNRTKEVNNYINIVYMKAKSKSQLAEMAGVSVDTLREWMKPFRQDLEAMGLRQNARVLPPNIVKFLAEKLCIDVED